MLDCLTTEQLISYCLHCVHCLDFVLSNVGVYTNQTFCNYMYVFPQLVVKSVRSPCVTSRLVPPPTPSALTVSPSSLSPGLLGTSISSPVGVRTTGWCSGTSARPRVPSWTWTSTTGVARGMWHRRWLHTMDKWTDFALAQTVSICCRLAPTTGSDSGILALGGTRWWVMSLSSNGAGSRNGLVLSLLKRKGGAWLNQICNSIQRHPFWY